MNSHWNADSRNTWITTHFMWLSPKNSLALRAESLPIRGEYSMIYLIKRIKEDADLTLTSYRQAGLRALQLRVPDESPAPGQLTGLHQEKTIRSFQLLLIKQKLWKRNHSYSSWTFKTQGPEFLSNCPRWSLKKNITHSMAHLMKYFSPIQSW